MIPRVAVGVVSGLEHGATDLRLNLESLHPGVVMPMDTQTQRPLHRRATPSRALLVAFGTLIASLTWTTGAGAQPANDDCATPTVITALPFADMLDTTNATTAASDPVQSCSGDGPSQNSKSVWYSFTPASDGMLTAFTAGSSYDTVLTVYTSSCGEVPTEVACNDDDKSGSTNAQAAFAVTAGTTYLIEVTAFQGSGGGTLAFGLETVLPFDNDDCAAPSVIANVPFTATLDITDATTSVSDPFQSCSQGVPSQNPDSVWFSFTPASDGTVTASTFASNYDTVLTAYTGTCGALVEVACNDDFADESDPSSTQSRITFPVTAGTTYLLEVTDFFGDPGTSVLHFSLDFAPPATIGKAADKCQKAIKAAGGKFVGKKLKSLDQCSNGVLKCIQTAPNDKRDACVQKAGKKCVGELAKIAQEDGKLQASIRKACSEGLVSFANLEGATGLGYDDLAAGCQSEFGIDLNDAAAVAQCVALHHECRTEEIFGVQEPRARELIKFALQAQVPPVSLDTLGCLADHDGSGAGLENEVVGKGVEKCEATIKKAAAKFVQTKLGGLEKCVDAVFSCVQTKPGDSKCRAKARATCDKSFTKIGDAAAKLFLTVDKQCLALDFDLALSLAEGANFAALAPTCAAFGVPSLDALDDYEQCLFQQHECLVEQLLRFEAPRAEGLLGLVGRELQSPFCPD